MQMRQNVKNDVSKNYPIVSLLDSFYFITISLYYIFFSCYHVFPIKWIPADIILLSQENRLSMVEAIKLPLQVFQGRYLRLNLSSKPFL